MEHFYNTLSKKGQDFLDKLFNSNCLITEKIDGEAFSIEKTDDGWDFYKRNAKKPINVADRTIDTRYEDLISYFENLSDTITDKIESGLRFEMEHVSSLKPNLISYDEIPKNNLILHSISKYKDGKLISKIEDISKLDKYADLLNVSRVPIIFQGVLSNEQKQSIKEFLNTPNEQLIEKFKTESFTGYIFSILNPKRKRTFLQTDLSKNIEGIVFWFDDEKVLAKLVDPWFEFSIKNKKQESGEKESSYKKESDEFLKSFEDFISNINLDDYLDNTLKGWKSYIEIISNIFVDFVNSKSKGFFKKFEDISVNITEDYLKDYKVNVNFLNNNIKKILLEKPYLNLFFRLTLSVYKFDRKRFTGFSNIRQKFIKDLALNINESNYMLSLDEFKLLNENIIYENNYKPFRDDLKPCNMIMGKFQPFTKGHEKLLETAKKHNGYPTFIIGVRRKKGIPILSDELTTEIFSTLEKENKNVCGFDFINMGTIGLGVKKIHEAGFEPVAIFGGSDRIKEYNRQVDYIFNHDEIPNEMEVVEIPRSDEDISATKLRAAILEDDEKQIKELMPKGLLKFVDEIKKELSNESV